MEPVLDKREAITEVKKNLGKKWKLKVMMSEKMDRIQEVFNEAGNRNCFGKKDRMTFAALNQLLNGHSFLNDHRAKMAKNVSNLCPVCKVPETVEHYLFDCDAYTADRQEMEKTVEEILFREEIFCSVVNLRVLSGNIESVSKESQTELISALLKYIKCTKSFD